MIKKIFFLLFIFAFLINHAQEKCGYENLIQQKIKENPEYLNNIIQINLKINQWINNNHEINNIITIPVVVHVVWKSFNGIDSLQQNISDAQIKSQIDILNQDYRRQNIDQINTEFAWQNIASDCEIEFCLANKDPFGMPTNGINRVSTTHEKFFQNSDIHTSSAGGADDWPNQDYLNIWVCDLVDGLLGYASPPNNTIGDGDGVVINYTNFGLTSNPPYHKGRTTTHEVGHWLNLQHLWGLTFCGDDFVSDTPKQEYSSTNCPAFPLNPNSCGTINSDGEMFQNFMDYTNDACMNLFTYGQKDRMHAAVNIYRPNMLSHNLCEEITNTSETILTNKRLVKIIDVLGRDIQDFKVDLPLFFIFSDGSVEKKIIRK